jgi:hypothetical protein
VKRPRASHRDDPTAPADIAEAIERICGVPCPAPDAPNQAELWAEHEVVGNFCLSARFLPPGEAQRNAAEFTLQNPVYPLDMTRPHIERGLGRKLTDDEIALKAILD